MDLLFYNRSFVYVIQFRLNFKLFLKLKQKQYLQSMLIIV
jgi:hypothetical protein